ncbi:molybdenum ABC transporter periplasmic molybdate-binding protein [Hyphomicrobium denitrificans 1NES1]|uniref:Molybdenum ABC transporter periplasmic molybdate-binding protein n=1 Tax=Hyphomicrobium denitrificans 1NES1 TaxID=670307 RepID=N0B362_9HYPH|nr:molybdate ABC transporter substrate-binding protein [Hyphomicrobium denitrificans]AGK56647.1 molybdenum ABC transporter periplasmic molybdate-binding protein [Hyphomicrobium denitrificans 1NES1]
MRARQILPRSSFKMFAVGMLALSVLSAPAIAQKAETTTTVFAAASLKTALDAVSTAYQKSTGSKIVVSYAASSALAKQIEQGAPADIFISADLDWMDYVDKAKLIKDDTRFNMLGNRLVLIAPASSTASLKIESGFALAEALGDGRLAMADVKSVPAGKYGSAALKKLGIWDAIEPKVAQAENVRAALGLVAQGEAPFGIVYETDATAEPKVKIVGVFPDDTHPPIIYPIAVTAGSKAAAPAEAFITYLKSPEGQAAFAKQGFTILK